MDEIKKGSVVTLKRRMPESNNLMRAIVIQDPEVEGIIIRVRYENLNTGYISTDLICEVDNMPSEEIGNAIEYLLWDSLERGIQWMNVQPEEFMPSR